MTSITKLITYLWMVSGKLLNNQWYLEMLVQRHHSPAGAGSGCMCLCGCDCNAESVKI